MSGELLAPLVAGLLGALLVLALVLRSVPHRLVKTNISGRPVPAILGAPLVAGGALALVVASLAAGLDHTAPAAGVVLLMLGVAGAWDDAVPSAADERGFRSHLRALGRGRVTTGIAKIVAGLVAGSIAGILVADGWDSLVVALLIAATANLLNLLDRAPGRAAKVGLLVALPLMLVGTREWALAAVGTVAAALVVLPLDLRERGMLGDAGSNPLGGMVGLGLGLVLDGFWRVAVLVLVVALNLASERWSFSAVIARVPLLARLDDAGRRSARIASK